jgi:hypothetical protein
VLLLPGGHAPGMRQYLGSPVLRDQVVLAQVHGAIRFPGHGVAARPHGRCLSARWPGDAYLFARRFSEMLAVSSGGGGLPGR